MSSLVQLEHERKFALKKCEEAKEKMKESVGDPTVFSQLAQQANDAWLEYKQKDIAFTNQLVFKQMGDLYGC